MYSDLRPADDRLQMAQCYLLGELSDVEAAEFESRLADDLLLAEALADAVLLHEAVAGVPAPSLAVRSTGSGRMVRRFGWSVAAVLMVGLVAVLQRDTPSRWPEGFSRSDVLETLFDRDEAASDGPLLDGPLSESVEPVVVDSAGEESDNLDVPDWMFAALEASRRLDDAGPPQEEEL